VNRHGINVPRLKVLSINLLPGGELMNQITTVGVDLAKAVIVVCAADVEGHVQYFKQLSFKAFAQWVAMLPPCTFGMEACSSAHHWGRRLAAHGHTARLMGAEFVKPFRKSQGAKNDRNDAQAILTAMRQPDMRFVSVKTIDQQAILAWHCMRRGWTDEKTALMNRLRGLLAEFGVWLARSPEALMRAIPQLMEDEKLPERLRPLLTAAQVEMRRLDERIESCTLEIRAHAKHSEDAQRIEGIIGVGSITSSAIVATVTDARDFKNGRQMAAWLGLVPKQYSSGGRTSLGRITKRGDTYLRGLLFQGACSALMAATRKAPEKRGRLQHWMVEAHQWLGYYKAVVAIANKNARMIWAILAKGESYDPDAWQRYAPRPV
jgi:transposase